MPVGLTKREFLDKRFDQLRLGRASWDVSVRDICELINPYRIVKDPSQVNRGERRDQRLYSSKAIRANRTLAAGMMAGITSPARKWFRLTTQDPEMITYKPVAQYLAAVESQIYTAFAKSNFYKELSNGTYLDIGSHGNGPLLHEADVFGAMRFRSMPWGEYYLDINAEGRVDTCFREFSMTVRQIVEMFGLANATLLVRDAWDRGNYNNLVPVRHAVSPNDDYSPGQMVPIQLARHDRKTKSDEFRESKPFKSCFWEISKERDSQLLREEGYYEFPVLAPRWSTTATDAYGRGPGWIALPEVKELQHQVKTRMQLLDKVNNPPLRATDEVKRASLIPGAIIHIGQGEAKGMVEPVMSIDARAIEETRHRITELDNEIREIFHANLWQMLTNDDRAQRPTATEVEYRGRETALQLGPLLESANDDMLEPAVVRAYGILERADLLPPPPPEVQGQEFKVEFVSIMHQMQRSTGLASIQTLIAEVGQIATLRPDVLDKLDADAIIDDLQQITGVRPDLIRDKREVESLRRVRAENEQAAQTGQAMLTATQGISNLSGTDPDQLQQLAGALSPVVAAQGGYSPV